MQPSVVAPWQFFIPTFYICFSVIRQDLMVPESGWVKMKYCPQNDSLDELIRNHELSHCFSETLVSSIIPGYMIIAGVAEYVIYRKYATPVDTQLFNWKRSALFNLQVIHFWIFLFWIFSFLKSSLVESLINAFVFRCSPASWWHFLLLLGSHYKRRFFTQGPYTGIWFYPYVPMSSCGLYLWRSSTWNGVWLCHQFPPEAMVGPFLYFGLLISHWKI